MKNKYEPDDVSKRFKNNAVSKPEFSIKKNTPTPCFFFCALLVFEHKLNSLQGLTMALFARPTNLTSQNSICTFSFLLHRHHRTAMFEHVPVFQNLLIAFSNLFK